MIRIQKCDVKSELYDELFEAMLPHPRAIYYYNHTKENEFYANMIMMRCYLYVGESFIEINTETGKVSYTTFDGYNWSKLLKEILSDFTDQILEICKAYVLMKKFNHGKKSKRFIMVTKRMFMGISICNICGDIIIGGYEGDVGLRHVTEIHVNTPLNNHLGHHPADYCIISEQGGLECLICGEVYDAFDEKDLHAIRKYNYCGMVCTAPDQVNSLFVHKKYTANALIIAIKNHLLEKHSDAKRYKNMITIPATGT